MNCYRGAFVLAALSLAGGIAQAQQNTHAQPADSGAVIRAETKVVLVDAVVTDKKGNYIRDLKAKDFRVWEDNKEQTITSFSFEADPASPSNAQPRYMVLFFDNASMDFAMQATARAAAAKFIDTNAAPNRLMAVVNYGGSLQISQNFTADAERLKAVVKGVKFSSVSSNSVGGLSSAASDFGVRNVILALRSLAKNLASVPGRKTLIFFTAGFPVPNDMYSDLTAAIDACNKSNVAIYPIDGRGLVTPVPGAGPRGLLLPPSLSMPGSTGSDLETVPPGRPVFQTASFRPGSMAFAPQTRPPIGNPPGGGGRPTPPAPPVRPAPNPTPPGGGRSPTPPPNTGTNRPPGGVMTAPRTLIPRFPESAVTNQNVMHMLAEGTGGFVIVNTNDLLAGLEKIGKEQNEYYLLGYTPPESGEGSCHTLRVKVDHSETVRARSGYCVAKSRDALAASPIEKVLENRAAAQQAGNVAASMQAPFFYTSPNVARVNVAMDIQPGELKFDKEKGKFRSMVHILGIAYRPDGSIGARFSDTVKLEFENKKDVETFKTLPYHYENQFDVASGKYILKVVFSSGGESFGKLETPLTVDSYDGQRLSLSAVALSTNLRKASDMAGSALDAALIEDRTPLVAQGFQIVPSGSNRFKSTDKAAMYFEVYEPLLATPDPAKPVVVAAQIRVLDGKTGAQKSDTGLFRLELPEKAGNTALPFGLKMPTESLTPGSYRLELSAMDSAGASVKRYAEFEIQ